MIVRLYIISNEKIESSGHVNYYIYKFSSSRLDDKFRLSVRLQDTFKSGELVRIEDSQLLRTIKSHKNHKPLMFFKKKYVIGEIVSLTFETDAMYYSVCGRNAGFYLNNKKYVRLMCPPSQGRKRTVIFIQENLFDEIHTIFLNGAQLENEPINPSKFNAYYSLYASASTPVSLPRVCVIDDYEMQMYGKVNFVDEDNHVYKKDAKDLPFMRSNVWDGQGLISPELARKWSVDILGDNYNQDRPLCNFVVRHAFLKGCVVTFDFQRLALMNNIKKITDIWGNKHYVQSVDLIISRSMMKLNTGYYDSWQQYVDNCTKNNLHWAVTIYNHLYDNEMKTTNYQYLQALDLTDQDIEEIASYSVKLIRDIKSKDCDVSKLLLFLSSGVGTDILGDDTEPFIKALMLCPELLSDTHIQKK